MWWISWSKTPPAAALMRREGRHERGDWRPTRKFGLQNEAEVPRSARGAAQRKNAGRTFEVRPAFVQPV
jgi:hypothetical protein